MRKKEINDEYYLIGYEKDGKNYYLMEPYCLHPDDGHMVFGQRLAVFTREEAFEQCKEMDALYTIGSKILVNLTKVRKCMDDEIIFTLFNIKKGEIR